VNKPLSQNDQLIKPIENAVHLCVDMQRIFARGGIWETPWMERVLPTIADIVDRHAERTVFTRFITPNSPDDASGQWRPYFRRWKIATRRVLAPSQLDLVPELARFVPPATVIDKPAYSAFFGSPLANFLVERHVRTIIVSGAETDVCVLSTVLDAVDIGFRVVIVEDALCSSSDVGHDALMTMYRTRFNEQIDLVEAECLRDIWADA
jgi:nicotinamidase-related amidase